MVESKRIEDDDEHELTSNTPSAPPKGWGFVGAKPSEYLVVYRKGALDERRGGQGARIWKWPSDSIAIVPTTLKEVVFKANQITQDNVDVRVRGMVVYRISDPPRICKLINFEARRRNRFWKTMACWMRGTGGRSKTSACRST